MLFCSGENEKNTSLKPLMLDHFLSWRLSCDALFQQNNSLYEHIIIITWQNIAKHLKCNVKPCSGVAESAFLKHFSSSRGHTWGWGSSAGRRAPSERCRRLRRCSAGSRWPLGPRPGSPSPGTDPFSEALKLNPKSCEWARRYLVVLRRSDRLQMVTADAHHFLRLLHKHWAHPALRRDGQKNKTRLWASQVTFHNMFQIQQ